MLCRNNKPNALAMTGELLAGAVAAKADPRPPLHLTPLTRGTLPHLLSKGPSLAPQTHGVQNSHSVVLGQGGSWARTGAGGPSRSWGP